MSNDSDVVVSVIVPAYNAEATLEETLTSIAQQRHRALEILIVDDGSTDQTPAIATRFCSRDTRARLLRQANGGVASARNLGLRTASADYVAPIDADDIWHPDHLAGLLARMLASSPKPGFVCARYRLIDSASRVFGSGRPIELSPNGVDALLRHNFVGNGSGLLLDRAAALAVGGYEERLRSAGAEGCEDYLLQLRIADRYPIAMVDAFTVGYRRLPTSMSGSITRMMRSRTLALELFFSARQQPVPALKWLHSAYARALGRERWTDGQRSGAASQLLRAVALDTRGTLGALLRQALFLLFDRADRTGRKRPPFSAVGPHEQLKVPMDRARRWTSISARRAKPVPLVP